MPDAYSTGLPKLDDSIGGGLPPGTLTVAAVPPEAGGRLLGHNLVIENRPAQYLTTYRTPSRLECEFKSAATGGTEDTNATNTDTPAVQITDLSPQVASDAEDSGSLVDDLTSCVNGQDEDSESSSSESKSTDDGGVLILDSLSDIASEGGRPAVRRTLDFLLQLAEERGLAVLAFVDGDTPDHSGESLALRAADLLFTYEPAPRQSEDDLLVVRRVRQASGRVKDLPATLPISLSETLEQSPDQSY